jgi:hypothetical protein
VGQEQDSHDLHFFTKHVIGIDLVKPGLRKPLFFKAHHPYDFGDICSATGFVYDALHLPSKSRLTMQAQRKPAKPRATRTTRAPRPEYIAAVRYPEGHSEIFHIRNADSIADARELVISEVGDVRSVMIALRH